MWVVDEIYQSSNTCHEPYKHKTRNGLRTSGEIESEMPRVKGLGLGSVTLQKPIWIYLEILLKNCLACKASSIEIRASNMR